MSSQAAGTPAGSSQLRPEIERVAFPLSVAVWLELTATQALPSTQAKKELLDAAFVRTVYEMGSPWPGDGLHRQEFDDRLDALYRQSLVSRRPVRLPDNVEVQGARDVDARIRVALLARRAGL